MRAPENVGNPIRKCLRISGLSKALENLEILGMIEEIEILKDIDILEIFEIPGNHEIIKDRTQRRNDNEICDKCYILF